MIKTETGLMRCLDSDPDVTVGRCWGGLRVRLLDGKKPSVLPRLIQNLEEAGKIVRIDDRSSKIGEEWVSAKWIRK